MATIASCQKCGSAVAPNDAGGICPRCLMGLGMNDGGGATITGPANGSFPIPRMEELVGKFPNLQIEHFIGHGGMGAVYQARQIGLDRPVALKILSPRLGADPAFTERFAREARTLAKLAHPNIVMVFEHGKNGDMNYLVMEFVDGINLRDAISEGKLSPQEALTIVPQICDALQYAHDEGVIHRDIKPENILIDKKGRVKIADFGLAKLLEPSLDEFTLTGTQQVMGTRNYMAPEQIETPNVVDHRADLYSLGVVFYELLTGELPLGRFSLPSEKAAVNNQLDDVVLRTLEKEPGRRFQQASEIKMAVDSIVNAAAVAEPVISGAQPKEQSYANSHFQSGAHQTGAKLGGAIRCSLPFSISELYGGLACAYGIAHLDETAIELEYEVQDEVFGTVKSGAKKVRIPVKNIISIDFVRGIFSDRVDVQTDRLEITNEIPNSKQARFKLGIKRADADRARGFVAEVDRLGRLASPFSRHPEPPVKSAPRDKSTAGGETFTSLKAPRIGFLVAAWINLASAAAGLLSGSNWKPVNEIFSKIDWLPNLNFTLFSVPVVSYASLFTLGFAIWLFVLAGKINRQTDYLFVLISSILLLLFPAHPAYGLVLIFSIWTLVVLSDPKAKAAFRSESKFIARASFGGGSAAEQTVQGVMRVLLLIGLVGAFLLGTLGLFYLVFTKSADNPDNSSVDDSIQAVVVEPAKAAVQVSPQSVNSAESKGIAVEASAKVEVHAGPNEPPADKQQSPVPDAAKK